MNLLHPTCKVWQTTLQHLWIYLSSMPIKFCAWGKMEKNKRGEQSTLSLVAIALSTHPQVCPHKHSHHIIQRSVPADRFNHQKKINRTHAMQWKNNGTPPNIYIFEAVYAHLFITVFFQCQWSCTLQATPVHVVHVGESNSGHVGFQGIRVLMDPVPKTLNIFKIWNIGWSTNQASCCQEPKINSPASS